MKLVSLILPLYFQVGVSFPASTSKKLQSRKQGLRYNSLKHSWLASRHGVYRDILEQLSVVQNEPQKQEQARNLAKLLDDLEVLTYSKKVEKLHRRKKSAGCTDFACTGDRATEPTTTSTSTTSPSPPPTNPATSSAAAPTTSQTTTETTTASTETPSTNISTDKLQELAAKARAIIEKMKLRIPTFPFSKLPIPTFPIPKFPF